MCRFYSYVVRGFAIGLGLTILGLAGFGLVLTAHKVYVAVMFPHIVAEREAAFEKRWAEEDAKQLFESRERSRQMEDNDRKFHKLLDQVE